MCVTVCDCNVLCPVAMRPAVTATSTQPLLGLTGPGHVTPSAHCPPAPSPTHLRQPQQVVHQYALQLVGAGGEVEGERVERLSLGRGAERGRGGRERRGGGWKWHARLRDCVHRRAVSTCVLMEPHVHAPFQPQPHIHTTIPPQSHAAPQLVTQPSMPPQSHAATQLVTQPHPLHSWSSTLAASSSLRLGGSAAARPSSCRSDRRNSPGADVWPPAGCLSEGVCTVCVYACDGGQVRWHVRN